MRKQVQNLVAVAAALVWGCGIGEKSERAAEPHRDRAAQVSAASPAGETQASPKPVQPKSCTDWSASLDEARKGFLASQDDCEFRVDCLTLSPTFREIEKSLCARIREADCSMSDSACNEGAYLGCQSERCVPVAEDSALEDAVVPEQNKVGIEEPPRPSGDQAQMRAQRLLDAIVRDEPLLAANFFFPQEAFRKVKAIPDPDRYWRKLFTRYQKDIHALHGQVAKNETDKIEFERLEVVRRGGFVRRGEEGNALPYWAARHNWLHYLRNGKPEKFEVRVLITWGERWYITHLSEFH